MAVAALRVIEPDKIEETPDQPLDLAVARFIERASDGDCDALFELGVIYSTGSNGVRVDLVEAHKWFNLAALGGNDEAKACRADISDEMTAREIADAQRDARDWLSVTARRVA
ncbi:hypothetical protein T8S45_10725 [Blastomonas marina]|uniref:Sel1 repeat family protein n=1 Tax=Blastomonas marina TaxID=1867408 RepID=A0ABQ1FHE5_9SPHN|nr:hypothetical protein [Blastomonas marina]WPZ03300.1 hypothetical protein T8S45_10725 [Blastomonas marina]GGA10915.1 hypothetical protein GCM10010923_21880 [Blastomonas marina]